MYASILKKDLKRKKTMNLILFLFIILATTFIAGSVNNMQAVMTALDTYFEEANVPDQWIAANSEEAAEKAKEIAEDEGGEVLWQELIQVAAEDVLVGEKKIDYSNTIVISDLKNTNIIFTEDDEPLQEVKEGEMYAPTRFFGEEGAVLQVGDEVTIELGDVKKTFTVKGGVKDALFGSGMIGMSRLLVSEKDYEELLKQESANFQNLCIYVENTESFRKQVLDANVETVFNEGVETIKVMYIMDMVIAAVMLIVSICLILISMVILRFTIQFTLSEEFREIGVMKALGIGNYRIRGLYIVKYTAIAIVGGVIGFFCSIPFSKMMLTRLSKSIMISSKEHYGLNLICTILVVAIVVGFCYLCTRKIRTFSPIAAIRNGENGERYRRKGLIYLNRVGMRPILFMAVNDIISDFRRYISLVVIFILGILLLLVPINTINTLSSDKIATQFNMALSDHVISREMIFQKDFDNRESVEEELQQIQDDLSKKGIPAETFMEMIFRFTISHGEEKTSSLAFQGFGDVTTEDYIYLEGSAPQNEHEVAITHIVSDTIGAGIGDTVEITYGDEVRKYTVSAIYQSMNNGGEGIRMYEKESLDLQFVSGSFGMQVRYTDEPDAKELERRKEILNDMFPEDKVYDLGEYVVSMIGDIVSQIESVKQLILLVVLVINILVTVLMVRSFLAKEKREIAVLKSIGFRNTSLIMWQTMRIGVILVLSILIGVLISTPVSQISSGQVFKIMGSESIQFEIEPLEVYLIYPLILLIATSLAAFCVAGSLRKIKTSETGNAE